MNETRDVLVVGGGLAGLSAAVALSADGAKVTLLERRPETGGRVYSYPHPSLGETVDSQHVVVGCCTNLLGLLAESGGSELIRWYDELVFLEPNGHRSWMKPGGMPAPGHQTFSFLRAPMLSFRDKAGIAAGLMEFLRGYPADDRESFATWVKRTGQTDRAIRHFWEPVVVSTLNDVFERCSTKYAGKVFHETFLRSPEGGLLGIPVVPLSEFLAPIVQHARDLGVNLERASVERITTDDDGWTVFSDRGSYRAGSVVIAANFKEAQRLLPEPKIDTTAFLSSPITTIQLWYDRDVTDLDHAVLLDTRIQWMFTKSRIRRWASERGSYLELTISASWAELAMSRKEIVASALRELALFFPAIHQAKLLKSDVLKEARATFSVTPGLDRHRPSQETMWAGLYLAGDWTATGWPSTMEGAVRSGRLAAGAIAGEKNRYMAPELAASGMMRWLLPS